MVGSDHPAILVTGYQHLPGGPVAYAPSNELVFERNKTFCCRLTAATAIAAALFFTTAAIGDVGVGEHNPLPYETIATMIKSHPECSPPFPPVGAALHGSHRNYVCDTLMPLMEIINTSAIEGFCRNGLYKEVADLLEGKLSCPALPTVLAGSISTKLAFMGCAFAMAAIFSCAIYSHCYKEVDISPSVASSVAATPVADSLTHPTTPVMIQPTTANNSPV